MSAFEIKPYSTWVVVSPKGLHWVGLVSSELEAWTIAFGWPDKSEVEAAKKSGWYAAKAEITWKRPEASP